MHGLVDELKAEGYELRETHISWVLLGARDVYKLKKPVDLGFLDFSTLPRRERACRAEVELNRRLAPDAYLGVLALVRDATGRLRMRAPEQAPEGILEWVVHMRRLPDAQRADLRLAQSTLTPGDLERLAERLAEFHARARCDAETSRFGSPSCIEANVEENFAQTAHNIGHYLAPAERTRLRDWQESFLREHVAWFEDRVRQGRVRDGHGDLRLEHAYLDDEGSWTVLDCIEFNERFRHADVCADIAFLSMDLAWHERVDLAERFLAAYARASGDYGAYPLLDFYQSYRAFVRAKVTSLLADDPELPSDVRERAQRETRRYYLLALAATEPSAAPNVLVAVGGLIASGKSTVAEALAHELAAPAIGSDLTRKQLFGVSPTHAMHDAAWQGAYAPERNDEVYSELLRRGEAVLRSGRSVVLDASFRSQAHRERLRRLAHRHQVELVFVECRVPRETSLARLAKRAQRPHVSDGRRDIFDDFAARWQPVGASEVDAHLIVDTSQPLETNLERLRPRLPIWVEHAGRSC